MKSMTKCNGLFVSLGLMAAILGLTSLTFAQQKQLSAVDIINKHIEAIGGKESFEKAKGRMAIGAAEFVSRQPRQTLSGHSVFASDGTDIAFLSKFEHAEYSQERIGVFGGKITIPFLKTGSPPPLAAYIRTNDRTLSDRLFGGVLFSTWRLLDISAARGKFEADGKKKIEGRDTWVIRYRPKPELPGGSSVRLYFDAETFYHVRTVMDLAAVDSGFYETQTGNDAFTPAMASNGSKLTEDFSDFKMVNGLNLPHDYRIDLYFNGQAGTIQFKWNFKIAEHRIVNDFGKGFFNFST